MTPAVKPGAAPWKAGLKAGGTALAFMVLFAALDYHLWKSFEEKLEADMQQVRDHTGSWTQREKDKHPDKPVYITWTVRTDDYTRYFPLLGWVPDQRRLILAGFRIGTENIDPPTTEYHDHRLDVWRPGETTIVRFSELVIP